MSLIALAAALAFGSLFVTADAQARGRHGGPHFSHGFAGHGFAHRGYYGGRHYGFYRGYRPYLYAGGYGCYRLRRVWTPYGPVLRRVNVCGPYRGYPYGYY